MIGVVIVVYSNYPEKLIESISDSKNQVKYYVFFHGTDSDLDDKLKKLVESKNSMYLPYGTNRGLARSWNEGIRFSFHDMNSHTLIINDDVYFRPSCFDQFIDFLCENHDYEMATVNGLEIGGSPHAGQTIVQQFACFAVGKLAIKKIGYLDQNFSPAYYEDIDYMRRMSLSGLRWTIDDRILVEHNRSLTSRSSQYIQSRIENIMKKNGSYYEKKWGGPIGSEKFSFPFNDPNVSISIALEDVEDPYQSTIYHCNDSQISLDQIGVKTNTDKSSIHHNYLVFYEKFLESNRQKPIKLLEIGVAGGASARMWEEYFPNAQIVAADINPDCLQYKSNRITIEISDQSDPRQMSELAAKYGPFDVVIDDGSHFWEHQITSFRYLFPFVKWGGIYILEDLDTSYGSYQETYRGLSCISAAEYLKLLLDYVVGDAALDIAALRDPVIRSFAPLVESMNFYRRTCVIKRKVKP